MAMEGGVERSLIIKPVGNLTQRLEAIVSGLRIAALTERRLGVAWPEGQEVYSQAFLPLPGASSAWQNAKSRVQFARGRPLTIPDKPRVVIDECHGCFWLKKDPKCGNRDAIGPHARNLPYNLAVRESARNQLKKHRVFLSFWALTGVANWKLAARVKEVFGVDAGVMIVGTRDRAKAAANRLESHVLLATAVGDGNSVLRGDTLAQAATEFAILCGSTRIVRFNSRPRLAWLAARSAGCSLTDW